MKHEVFPLSASWSDLWSDFCCKPLQPKGFFTVTRFSWNRRSKSPPCHIQPVIMLQQICSGMKQLSCLRHLKYLLSVNGLWLSAPRTNPLTIRNKCQADAIRMHTHITAIAQKRIFLIFIRLANYAWGFKDVLMKTVPKYSIAMEFFWHASPLSESRQHFPSVFNVPIQFILFSIWTLWSFWVNLKFLREILHFTFINRTVTVWKVENTIKIH